MTCEPQVHFDFHLFHQVNFYNELVHYLMQYRERVIFIGQEIDEEFSNQILGTLLYLDSVDNSKMLYLYINGPGGDVSNDSSGR